MITDTNPHPMTPLDKPGQGQTVIDPDLGGAIVRVTDAPPGHAIKPAYSTVQAWSEDGTYLVLYHWSPSETSHELWTGDGSRFIRKLNFESITDEVDFIWMDSDTIYYCSNLNAEPRLMRHTVSTGENSLVQKFGEAKGWDRLLSLGGDPMWRSWGPSKVIGLKRPPHAFLYDATADKVLGYLMTPAGVAPGPSGGLAYSFGDVLDDHMKWLRRLDLANPGDHGCVGQDWSGGDVFLSVAFDPGPEGAPIGTLVVSPLSGEKPRCIVGPDTGYPYPPSTTHVSSVAHLSLHAMAAVSVVGDISGQGVLDQEILLADLTDDKVYRLCHHRSWAGEGGKFGYWAEPHAVIAPKGGRVLFGSDWGGGDSVDTYIVKPQ